MTGQCVILINDLTAVVVVAVKNMTLTNSKICNLKCITVICVHTSTRFDMISQIGVISGIGSMYTYLINNCIFKYIKTFSFLI